MLIGTTQWFELNIFGVILGSVLSLATSYIIYRLSIHVQTRTDRRTFFISLSQNNSELFSLLFRGVERDQDYTNLRDELKKANFIFLLPRDLRILFGELFQIYFTTPEYYKQNKARIKICIGRIVKKLEEYGDDFFGE